MAAIHAPSPKLDRYVVIHVATTCDEHGVYVTKDSAEVIELGWILLDAENCKELHRESVLVKPVNTPITPLCTSLTTLTWEHVRSAGTFRDAINQFDAFTQEHLLSKNLEFSFVTLDSWDMRVQLPREARDKAAAESLCMNGRALNDKAIEVSPSSSRVLDHAAEILTPFPPSKNRPRPGDWTCPSCGFSNFQRRTACFRCSFPAVGTGPDPMGYGGYGYGPPSMMPPPHHMGHHGGHVHTRGMGGNGGVVPFRAGDWKCGAEGCGYHNFAKNINCLRCGGPRSGAAVVADSAFPSPMEPPSGFGMGLASISSTPGPGPFASSAGGFGAFGQQFGGPASTYAAPSGLGAASGPYPPMGQMNQMNQMNAPYGSGNASHSAASFGNPATQAAFTGADHVPQPVGASNGNFYGNDASADPFAFLSTGLGALGVDDSRRNGASNNKSPA
ncbi:hypothetical protein I7I51_07511 [Histoplasma capsulatum]|uniref:RanBP2-type domain-containing protein n=1 Tax=Ajellomyces capsulatus TaxID=5037 RepID=A0A8A1LVZ2_AJECA|nr:hypothetical protein I7I51_07511 [Histoplasma capsulatum]